VDCLSRVWLKMHQEIAASLEEGCGRWTTCHDANFYRDHVEAQTARGSVPEPEVGEDSQVGCHLEIFLGQEAEHG